eukprot:m.226606 g.226606  ORF g.226606 m.226606 type:complete len:1651 (+) comp17313_c0_seq1:318-5270(+)
MQAQDADDGQHPDNFHVEFSSQLYYTGAFEVEELNTKAIQNCIQQLIKTDGSSPSASRRYVPVSLALSLSNVVTRSAKTSEVLCITPLSDVAFCCAGVPKVSADYFGYVTVNMIDAMPVGHICHVFRSDSTSIATTIAETMGRAFRSSAEQQDRRSLSSLESRDSGFSRDSSRSGPQPPSSTMAGPTSPRPASFGAEHRSVSALRKHRRTRSDGGTSPSPSSAGLSTSYLIEQTAQNIYRRLHSQPRQQQLIGTHVDGQGRQQQQCFKVKDVVTWLVAQHDFRSRQDAVAFLQTLLTHQLLQQVFATQPTLTDSQDLYRFALDDPTNPRARLTITEALATSPSSPTTRLQDGDSTPPLGSLLAAADLVEFDSTETQGEGTEKLPHNLVRCELTELMQELDDGSSTFFTLPPRRQGRVVGRCLQLKDGKRADVLVQAMPEVVDVPINDNGDTLLHWAARANEGKAASLLLRHGAMVNAANNQDQTPLHKAAGRGENLETAILLVESGAKVRAVNKSGKRPLDDMPHLAELQRRLCEALVADIVCRKNGADALVRAAQLAANAETHVLLCESLLKDNGIAQVAILCQAADAETAAATMVQRIADDQSAVGCDQDVLALLVQCVSLPLRVALAALHGLNKVLLRGDSETDQTTNLATLDLSPVVAMLDSGRSGPSDDISAPMLAARVLVAVTRLPKPRRLLLQADTAVANLLKAIQSALDQEADDVTEYLSLLLSAIGNICAEATHEKRLRGLGMQGALKASLHHTDRSVRQLAARALILLGETDVSGVDVFADCTAIVSNFDGPMHAIVSTPEAAALNVCPGSSWGRLKAASLERMVYTLTQSDGANVWIATFVYLVNYWPAMAILRLLLHRWRRLDVVDGGLSLPPLHATILDLLQGWLSSSPQHFAADERLYKTLRSWLKSLVKQSPVYAERASPLLEMPLTTLGTGRLRSGIESYHSASHERLYADAKAKVMCGETPVNTETAVVLAATVLHIDDLSRRANNPHANIHRVGMPPFKAKNLLPPQLLKGKDVKALKALTADIKEQYEGICERNERDAKHFYLHKYSLATTSDTTYFNVKVSFPAHPKKRIPYRIGVAPTRVLLLEDASQQVTHSFPLSTLRAWQIEPIRGVWSTKAHLKVSLRVKATPTCLMLSLIDTQVAIVADDVTYARLSSCLLEATQAAAIKLRQQARADRAEARKSGLIAPAVDGHDDEDDDAQEVFLGFQDDEEVQDGLSPTPETEEVEELDLELFAPADAEATQVTPISSPRTLAVPVEPARSRASTNPSKTASAMATPVQTAVNSQRTTPRTSRPTSPASSASSPKTARRTTMSTNATAPPVQSFAAADPRFRSSMLVSKGVVLCACPPGPALPPGLDPFAMAPEQLVEHPAEFARQLTLAEHGLFKQVTASEVLNKAKGKGDSTAADRLVHHFNAVNSFVAKVVLTQPSAEARVRVVQRLIVVASRCRQLDNYNGVMEIVSALGMTPVRRLTGLWDDVSEPAKKAFRSLETLMKPERNFARYRQALSKAKTPAIPYFGVYLRDLTFLHHGSPDYLRFGLLNVRKLVDMDHLLASMQRLQTGCYPLLVVPALQDLILNMVVVDEDELYQLSHAIQPQGMRKMSSASGVQTLGSQRSDSPRRRPRRGSKAQQH